MKDLAEQAAMARRSGTTEWTGKRRPARRRWVPRAWGPLREAALLLSLVLLLGFKFGIDALTESSSFRLLWLAGEVGYHLAAAEEAVGRLLP